MDEQYSEINLYDYYKVALKRKNIVFILVVLFTALSFIVALFSPKVYEAKSILRIATQSQSPPQSQAVTSAQDPLLISNVELNLMLQNFQTANILDDNTRKKIVNVQLTNIADLTGDYILLVQVKKNPESAIKISNKILSYLQNNELMKEETNRRKAALKKKISDSKKTLVQAEKAKNSTLALLKKTYPVGFNPVELESEINELQDKITDLKHQKESFKGIKFVSNPYLSTTPIKPKPLQNALLGFVVSLFLSIFIIFFLEWLDKSKAQHS